MNMTFSSRPLAALCLFLCLLAGCATVPKQAGLSAEQIAALRSEGFVQTDKGWEFGIADKLLFATDDSRIDDGQRQAIARIAQMLLSVGLPAARVEGHADRSGNEEHNRRLSLNRASAVADVMVDAGMDRSLLGVVGLGSDYPIASNQTIEGRQENRRVSIIVGG